MFIKEEDLFYLMTKSEQIMVFIKDEIIVTVLILIIIWILSTIWLIQMSI